MKNNTKDSKQMLFEIMQKVNPDFKIINEDISYTSDENSNIFLDKVKKENPEMFAKFLNIVKNKGLDIAIEKYKEFDKEYINNLKNIELNDNINKNLLISFIKTLPQNLPQVLNNDNMESDFFGIIGKYIDKYANRFGNEKANKIQDLITDEKYDDYFLNGIESRYGKGVIEW